MARAKQLGVRHSGRSLSVPTRAVAHDHPDLAATLQRDLGLSGEWRAVTMVRSAGTSAGQRDVYFIDPAGRRYRSRGEVSRSESAS